MDTKTIARYAENSGTATQSISAEVAARCSGNSETATRLKDTRKIIFNGDVEAEANFDGSSDLIVTVKNKSAEKAECDGQGNNISETYAKIEAVAGVCVSRKELTEYVSKTDFNFSFENFNGVPCLFIEIEGKKYKFVGVEV